jgi:hypothetical protein
VGLALAAVLALLLVAGLRTALEQVVRAVAALPAALLATGCGAAHSARTGLLGVVARARAALAYGDADAAGAWDVAAPLVHLLLLVVVLVGDVALAGLRFGALLGIPVDGLPVTGSTLDLLTGLLFLAVLATFGCVLLDAAHVTPLRRPYGLATGRVRSVLLGVAATGTALSALAAVLFFVWGQYAVFGRPSDDVATLFIAVFAVLLVGASILAAGGALGCVLALWTLLCASVAVLLAVAAALLDLAVVAVTRAADLLVSVIRLAARPGTVLWNWLADLPAGRRIGLHRLAEPVVEEERQSDVGLAAGP